MWHTLCDRVPIIGQIVAWITAIFGTFSLSDYGTLVGIFSSLAMTCIIAYNQNKRTKLLAASLKRRAEIIGQLPDESQINSD